MSYQNIIHIITEHSRLIIIISLSLIVLVFLFQKRFAQLLVAAAFIGVGLLVQLYLHSAGYIESSTFLLAIVPLAISISLTHVLLRLFDI